MELPLLEGPKVVEEEFTVSGQSELSHDEEGSHIKETNQVATCRYLHVYKLGIFMYVFIQNCVSFFFLSHARKY